MAFEIRRATREDVAEIRRVARESWHATYDDILGPESVDSVVDEWYDPEALVQSMDRDDGVFLVGERESGDAVAGFAQGIAGFAQGVLGFGSDDDAAELTRIYVHPDHWGAGLGSKLLGRVEAWTGERDAERLKIVVLADNDLGNGFYESHGYRVATSREVEFQGELVTEYVREKEL